MTEPIAAAELARAAEATDPRERRHIAEAGLRARRAELALYSQLYAERNGNPLELERLAARDELTDRLLLLAGASA